MKNIGDSAPDFDLLDQNGKHIKLSEIKSKFVVLYFYPKDLTPGCTIETCSLRDYNKEIEDEGATIIGIGKGDEKSKTKFSEKHDIDFSLLVDIDNSTADKYGVLVEKSMFGKKYKGINRVTYLLDENKKIVFIWEKVKPLDHGKEVLEKIRTLK